MSPSTSFPIFAIEEATPPVPPYAPPVAVQTLLELLPLPRPSPPAHPLPEVSIVPSIEIYAAYNPNREVMI